MARPRQPVELLLLKGNSNLGKKRNRESQKVGS